MLNTATKILLGAALMAATAVTVGCLPLCGGAEPGVIHEASVYPTDSKTDQPVQNVEFRELGELVGSDCGEFDRDDPGVCLAERLMLSPGMHTVEVSAEGYYAETIQIDTREMVSAHLAVQLDPVE